MTNELKPIHLLLLETSSNDAESLITTLRNNGYPVRATQVVKEDDLKELLAKQSWDLCLTRAEINGFNAAKVVSLIDEYDRDVPVILITNEFNEQECISALRSGIKDAVPFSSLERVFLVIKRELENLEQRKERKRSEIQLKETEKRCNLLLDSSQDAIAYIHDGMHIYANQSYVELFGFEDADEMLCMPIMDMITGNDHEKFKKYLRHYAKNPSNNQFACSGVKSDMSEFEVILALSNATYDDEECTQILIRNTSDSAELEAKVKELSAKDVLTGLYNHAYFQEQLDELISTNTDSGESCHLLFVELDQYDEVERQFGLSGIDDMVRDVASWFSNAAPEDSLLARYGNDSFMLLLPNGKPEEAKTFAESLCLSVSEHLFEIEGMTQKFTFSIGICPVGDKAKNAKETIANAHSACQRVYKNEGNGIKMFSRTIDQGNAEHAGMIEQIQEAIENGTLHLLFQPIVKLHGEEKAFYQSLLRLTTESGETVPPTDIFPIAEMGGIAAKLDRWVIMQSLKALRDKKSKATLFIHLSTAAMTDEGLLKYIIDLLKSSKIPASSIIFQISTRDAITYLKRVIVFSNTLSKMGVGVSLTHVTNNDEHITLIDQLLPKYVFIDGDMTLKLNTDGDAIAGISKVCSEVHQRDIPSVVPKVEDAASLAALWPLGIHYIQGFYLQAPSKNLDFDFASSEF